MQYHPHILRGSAANRMHVYIVDSLLGSMFTNGSVRTADVLYARGSLVHFAHKPAPVWTRKDHLQAYEEGLLQRCFRYNQLRYMVNNKRFVFVKIE